MSELKPFIEVERGDEDVRRILRVRTDVVRSQATGRDVQVDRVATANWVNIVALVRPSDVTPRTLTDWNVLLVRQYRFGSRTFVDEFVAGMVDDGEAAQTAAVRELREETGYAARDVVIHLGTTLPNPSFMENQLDTFLLVDVEAKDKPDLDGNEELEHMVVPVRELDVRLQDGRMQNALGIVAWARTKLYAEMHPEVFDAERPQFEASSTVKLKKPTL